MAAGEYVSVQSQADTEEAELKVERAELKADDKGEHQELMAIYVARGLDVNPQDLDIRVENNILTIRGERKFENKVNEENYLRVERAYGSFSRSFSLANSVKSDAIKADYQNGVLTLSVPKREEAKPKQIKVNVGTAAVAGAR
jgi:hypothetical protein